MKSLAVLAMATVLLVSFFQCCPSAGTEQPSIQAPAEQRAAEATQPPPTEPTAAPPPPEPTPTSPPPVAQPVLLEFSGQGNEATRLYPLDAGLIRCDYTHVGQSQFEFNFMAYLLDSQGDMAALVANEIGSCEGSSAGSIGSGGDYLLNVTADGDWTFRCDVNAPGTEPSPRQPVPVVELSGHGNEASDLIHLEGGLVRADYTHVGESEFEFNFMAYLLDSQGNMAALVANEIGSCEGSSASSIARAGDYVLDVTADGNWTITLSQ